MNVQHRHLHTPLATPLMNSTRRKCRPFLLVSALFFGATAVEQCPNNETIVGLNHPFNSIIFYDGTMRVSPRWTDQCTISFYGVPRNRKILDFYLRTQAILIIIDEIRERVTMLQAAEKIGTDLR